MREKVGFETETRRNGRRIEITRTKMGNAKRGRTKVKKKGNMDEEEKRRNAENGIQMRWKRKLIKILKKEIWTSTPVRGKWAILQYLEHSDGWTSLNMPNITYAAVSIFGISTFRDDAF